LKVGSPGSELIPVTRLSYTAVHMHAICLVYKPRGIGIQSKWVLDLPWQ
jgi:hypothetical protein